MFNDPPASCGWSRECQGIFDQLFRREIHAERRISQTVNWITQFFGEAAKIAPWLARHTNSAFIQILLRRSSLRRTSAVHGMSGIMRLSAVPKRTRTVRN